MFDPVGILPDSEYRIQSAHHGSNFLGASDCNIVPTGTWNLT